MDGDTSSGGLYNNTTKMTDHVNVKTCKDSHPSLVLTPRTEASTPDSGVYTTFNSRDSSTKKLSKNEVSVSLSHVGYGLQRHHSQTDDHIQQLDRNGCLDEVAGSQSMLSQELMDHDPNNKNDDSPLRGFGLSGELQSKSSVGIAKHIGLLAPSQDDDDEEEATVSSEQENRKEEAPASMDGSIEKSKESHHHNYPESTSNILSTRHEQEHSYPMTKGNFTPSLTSDNSKTVVAKKGPLSGLDLLTQVGINEASRVSPLSTTTITPNNNCDIIAKSGFGSLLDAVAKITEQEESEKLSKNGQAVPEMLGTTSNNTSNDCNKTSKKRKGSMSKPVSASKQRKSEMQKLKERLRREKIEQENKKSQAEARNAAMLAERTITDPHVAKKLLLSMALARENPRSVPKTLPGKGHVIQEGFFWVSRIYLEFLGKSMESCKYSTTHTSTFVDLGSLSSVRVRTKKEHG